jgi:uncharacterized protein YcbK (DUF882 family)
MTSRRFLIAAALGAVAALPGAAQARRPASGREVRRLAVQFAHTGAWFRGPFKNGAEYDPAAVAEFSAVVSDYRTGEVKQFDPAVLDLIWRVGAGIGVNQFTCVSGYRGPATNALVGGATDSQHLAARALDLWLPGTKLGQAVEHAVGLRAGGVGAYRSWVHLDTGGVRFWDHRRPGEEGPERESSMMTVAGRPGAVRSNRAINTNLLLPAPTLPPGPTPINNGALGRGRRLVIMEPLELQNSGTGRLPPLRVFGAGGR